MKYLLPLMVITMSFPQMSLDELKELNEVISKFLKDENI